MLKLVYGDSAVTMKMVYTSGSSGFVMVVIRLKTRRDGDFLQHQKPKRMLKDLIFIESCIILIFENKKANLTSLAFLFHFLFAQNVSDINISIIRSLRLFC